MKYSLVLVLSVLSFSTLHSAEASTKLIYQKQEGSKTKALSVVLHHWGLSKSADGASITISNPYLEAADEDYPLIFDDETLAEVCKLSGAGKVIASESAGSLNLTAGDMAAFSAEGTIVSDAQKHGLDQAVDPDAVIYWVTCAKN